MPQENSKAKLVESRIRERDERAVQDLSVIREMVKAYLIREKKFDESDIEQDKVFQIALGPEKVRVSVDYVLTLEGRRFMVIKCSPGALESRERHLVSFARVVEPYQIPLAAITDGAEARVLDTVSGKVVGLGLDSLPDKAEALARVCSGRFLPYPTERLEREKRVLLAFEAISCTEEAAQ